MALARTQYEEVQRDNTLTYSAAGTTVTHTVSELQWAVRAMTAEVKLSEREKHHKEMTSMLVRMNVSHFELAYARTVELTTLSFTSTHYLRPL